MADILRLATDYYLGSHDFNGIRLTDLVRLAGIENTVARVEELVSDGKLLLLFSDVHTNPFIKAFEPEPVETQIEKLHGSSDTCVVYPTRQHLEQIGQTPEYQDRPFTLRLTLGGNQLDLLSFELQVLEFYRNDPRYIYDCDDLIGWISIHDEHYESDKTPERDKVFIQSFGFSYDENFNRAVAVFLIDLARLSPEHQQIWKAKELPEDEYRPHPDFIRTQILGEWAERVSIFHAFTEELSVINRMTSAMGHPELFREALREKRPKRFAFLIRPTRKEFNDFIHTLDKMMSDNLNHKFFKAVGMEMEIEEERTDGKIIVRQKGTIALLDEWISKSVKLSDPGPYEEMIATFKKVRKLRQQPAHVEVDDLYDMRFFKDQRQLVMDAYNAVRTLRLILANHPATKDIDISEQVKDGKIWNI